MSHIFISYSHADSLYVSKLATELEKQGFSVWLDEHIPKGARWFLEIKNAIESCAAMIVVMTPNAEESEWVEQEIMLGRDFKKQIFPLLLAGERFAILNSRQYIDVRNGNLPSNELYDLLMKSATEILEPAQENRGNLPPKQELNTNPNFVMHFSFDISMFYSDPYIFQEHLVRLLEHQNNFGFRRYIREASQTFFPHIQNLSNGDTEITQQIIDGKLKPILDNLTVIGITTIEYDFYDLFVELVQAFHTIFVRAYGFDFPKLSDPNFHFSVSWIWQEVIKRVYVLGSVLVKHRKFSWIRYIVRQEVSWDNYYRKFYWSRFISISLATENRLPQKSLCIPVVELIKNSKYMTSIFFGNEDMIISTVCQFDFLQAINVLQEENDPYPNFGVYFKYRTEPIIGALIEELPVRDAIGHTSNHDLARYIWFLDQLAGEEFFSGAWHRNSWGDSSITEFLEKNLDV